MSYSSQFRTRPISNQGVYSASATYFQNDVVTFNGAAYACLVPKTTGLGPGHTDIWGPLVTGANLTVSNTGSGTNPENITLSLNNGVLTLNHG